MYPKNYYAWTYRRVVLSGSCRAFRDLLSLEVNYALSHLRSSPSDHCAVAYLDYALGLSGCGSSPDVDPWPIAVELEKLGDRYPTHPTITYPPIAPN